MVNTQLNQPLQAKSGYHLEVQFLQKNNFALSAFVLSGVIAADNRQGLNFKSTVFTEGLMLRYDFINKKNEDQVLIPYLTAGVEYILFRSKSDLKDGGYRNYNYWSDGTIRTQEENGPLSSAAQVVGRDYRYETSLRDANLDGTGSYRESGFGFPVGIGTRFKLSDKSSLNLGSVYHFTTTDQIDGVTASGKGNRKGNERNDAFLFTSIGFRYDFGGSSSTQTSDRRLNIDVTNVNFDALTNEDADGDGIPDIRDDSSGTPLYNKVDEKGRPIDQDDDGIPDYRDQEKNSARYAVVNEDGITITEAMIEEKLRKDSLAALPSVIEYLKAYDKLTERKPEAAKQWEKEAKKETDGKAKLIIPTAYEPLDTDKNGVLTPKEISVAIDDYLNKKSKYTVQQFFDLIDFFFQQH